MSRTLDGFCLPDSAGGSRILCQPLLPGQALPQHRLASWILDGVLNLPDRRTPSLAPALAVAPSTFSPAALGLQPTVTSTRVTGASI